MAAPVRRRVTDLPEYEDAAHLATPEPRATKFGATPRGRTANSGGATTNHCTLANSQRLVLKARVALKVLQREGGIGGYESYVELDSATPTGEEREPGNGFERGVRVHIRERK